MTKTSLYTCLGFVWACLGLTGSKLAHAQEPPPAYQPPPSLRIDGLPNNDQQRYALLERSRVLRAEIEDLRIERSQYGIAGPIVMMAGGGAATLGALYIYALSELVSDFSCSSSDCDNDNTTLNSFLAVVGVGGVVTALVGVVLLQNRLEPRRELARQIINKRVQLKSIEDSIRFSAMLGPHNVRGASLTLSF